MSDRIIIGEMERAGLPISAPARRTPKDLRPSDATTIRWLKDKHCFRLIVKEGDEWREVPCLTGSSVIGGEA